MFSEVELLWAAVTGAYRGSGENGEEVCPVRRASRCVTTRRSRVKSRQGCLSNNSKYRVLIGTRVPVQDYCDVLGLWSGNWED